MKTSKFKTVIPVGWRVGYGKVLGNVNAFFEGYDPKKCMNRRYKYHYHRDIDWENPIDLIEKTCWLEANSNIELWTLCADKYRVREYLKEKGCSKYMVKLLGHWDDPKDIDFSTLPKEFVLKTNHGSGEIIVVRDKSTINEKRVKSELKSWLKEKYGLESGQTHYTRIKPCVIAEELLHQSPEDEKLSPKSIIDYKVWCFHGKPEAIWVAYNRTEHNVHMQLFDTDWNLLVDSMKSNPHYTYHPEETVKKPECLAELLEVARKLSQPFPEVRADFYIIDGHPVFGELTFTAGYGFYTDEYYRYLGSKIDLTKAERI